MTNPGPEPEDARPLSGRLEWDAACECFVLRYTSSWKARMRCECRFGLHEPAIGLALAVSWPVALPVLAGTLALHRSDLASSLRIFSWGVRDGTTRMVAQANWPEFKRVALRGGDLFLSWRSPTNPAIPGCYFPRECFASEDEARFCEQILLGLWHSRGQSWSQARSQLIARETVRDAMRPSFDPPEDPFA